MLLSDSVIVLIEKLLPFKSLFLLVNASFRRLHVSFVRLLLETAPTESDNNIHAVILRQHGREVLKNLRATENTSLKIANWSNHRIFNIRCLLAGITLLGSFAALSSVPPW